MSGSWEGLFGSVISPLELLTSKINVRTAQGKQKHCKEYFWTNISHQEGLFKEFYSICFVHHWEGYNYHSISVLHNAVYFLGSNVC